VELPPDAIAKLGPDDLVLIETFFARALDLELETRASIASKILQRLCHTMGTAAPEGMSTERVLEVIAFQIRSQGSLR
jgi:hypothetical protein